MAAELTASFDATFWWQVLSGSVRTGLFAGATSGSPQLSFAPTSGSPSLLLEGDIWYEASGTTSDGNLYIGDTGQLRVADLLEITPENIM